MASLGFTAFADQRPPARSGFMLVTNNLDARDALGHMSHLWLVSMVHYHDDGPSLFNGRELAVQGEITAFAQPSDMSLRGLTHWRPACPEEWEVPHA